MQLRTKGGRCLVGVEERRVAGLTGGGRDGVVTASCSSGEDGRRAGGGGGDLREGR